MPVSTNMPGVTQTSASLPWAGSPQTWGCPARPTCPVAGFSLESPLGGQTTSRTDMLLSGRETGGLEKRKDTYLSDQQCWAGEDTGGSCRGGCGELTTWAPTREAASPSSPPLTEGSPGPAFAGCACGEQILI